MKQLLITIAAVVLVGCASTQLSESPTVKAPDISIHQAVAEGDIEAVKRHLNAGTDANEKSKSTWINYRKGTSEIVFTPLHYAASGNHKEIAELLITKGADVNCMCIVTEETPLHLASSREIAELLIVAGADVNAKAKGHTPLHHAAYDGHNEIIELLIAKGAVVNTMDEDGDTPLDWAGRLHEDRFKYIADLLRKHGAKTGEELKAAGN